MEIIILLSNLEIPPILISFSRDFIQVIAYSLTFLNQKSHGSIDWLGVIPALLLETDIESELTITLILYDKFHFPLLYTFTFPAVSFTVDKLKPISLISETILRIFVPGSIIEEYPF